VYSVHAADLDGDGDQDVLAAASFDNKVVWFENIQDCVGDNDCPACKKCIGLECEYQTNAEDVKNDCADADPCLTGLCDGSGSCGYEALDTPCADATVCNGDETCDGIGNCRAGTPLDCDDGDDCTLDSCDPGLGCQNTPDDSCGDPSDCIQDSDCDDGGVCAKGECTADHRCRYHPDGCDTQGPCGADSTCYYGYLWLEKGNALGNGIVVNSGIDTPVMQLKVTTEGVGGTLNQLQFDWRGPDRLWSGTTLAARLYEDSDHDGKIDANGSGLVATQAVDLANGTILFTDINQTIEPATEKSYLVTVFMETAQSTNVAGWVFPSSRLMSLLVIFLALFMVVVVKTKRPKIVLWVSMVLMLLAVLSCSRSGFEFIEDSRQASLQLSSNDYLKVQCVPNEQVWVQGAPLDSDVFVLNNNTIKVIN
jgi:hypothetical protein